MLSRPSLLAVLVVALILVGSATSTGAQVGQPKDPDCPTDTAYDPRSDSCAKVVDVRQAFPANEVTMASLLTLRGGQAPAGTPDPNPGDWAGTTYESGDLAALTVGSLYTVMAIHGDGIGNLPTSGWVFTTSTNRTEKGVEVVGVYDPGSYLNGKLGIFDWSCSASYPCTGGYTSPAWIWQYEFSSFNCNITTETNGSTHYRKFMYYSNSTTRKDSQNPPLWENLVLLWNYCSGTWNTIYTHQYRVAQADCHTTGCAWWGPILEIPTSGTETTMWELGFKDTWLYHDGTWSSLPESETDFSGPLAPWSLFYRVANRTWFMGNWY